MATPISGSSPLHRRAPARPPTWTVHRIDPTAQLMHTLYYLTRRKERSLVARQLSAFSVSLRLRRPEAAFFARGAPTSRRWHHKTALVIS